MLELAQRMTDRRSHTSNATIAALFFLSGACGLVYQIIWVRMLLPVFGNGIHAVSTVVAAFMTGLALGAWWFGRRADRSTTSGLRVYAALEAGIALCAVVLPLALGGLDELYTWLFRRLEGLPGAFAVARLALSLALLLLPTTLMGGTLPALVRHVAARSGPLGRSAALLYGLNTLGAVAGCAFAAFVSIEYFGVLGTNGLAATLNALIAAAAWRLSRRESKAMIGPAPNGDDARPPLLVQSRLVAAVALWGYALSGFAALGFEVIWSRQLAVTLRITTTQSLSAVLIVFLAGLAMGSAAAARRVDRWRELPTAFGLLQLALGLAGVLSIVALGFAPRVTEALVAWPGWYGHMSRLFVASGAVMLLSTFVMGLLFPVAIRLQTAGDDAVGRCVGRVCAMNTAGSIVGAITAGFVLVPWLGSQLGLVVLAAVNLAVGCAVLAVGRATVSRRATATALTLGGAAVGIVLLLPPAFLVRSLHQPGAELLYHAEAAAGTVTVQRLPDGIRLLRVNGAGVVPTDWDSVRIFRLLGTLPLLLHPRPDDVLVIAFGGGITLAMVESQRPRSIDCVEIVPGVVGAATHFADLNERVFERATGPTIHMIYDDGRNQVLRTSRSYDVILSDSTHPATADSWLLYTEEFYRQVKARLNPRGIFAQWLPIHGLTVDDYEIIVRTFHAVFPHATLWYSHGYSIMLGTDEPLAVDLAEVQRRLSAESAKRLLSDVDLDDPAAFLSTLALDERGFAAYSGTGRINTDDHPWIGFRDRTRPGAAGSLVVASLAPHFVGGDLAWVAAGDAQLREALGRRMAAVRLTIGAEIAALRGDRAGAIAATRKALEIAPQDETARRQLAAFVP